MSKKWLTYFILIFSIVFHSCYLEETVFDTDPNDALNLPVLLKLDGRMCFFDAQKDMLRYSLSPDSSGFAPFVKHNPKSILTFDGHILKNNKINHLGVIKIGKAYPLTIKNNGTIHRFELVFTNLPVVQIIAGSEIYDEPKTLAKIQITDAEPASAFSSYAGIERRGKFSKYFDKRSMGFALWENMNSTSEYSASVLGFKPNSDWILNSGIVDPSRVRNLVSFEIWNNLSPREDDGEPGHVKIHSKPVEVFLNNKLQGLYIFSERVNREFLNAGNEAVLYKAIDWSDGATRFERFNFAPSNNRFWNGWEQEIPDPDSVLNWKPLENLYELTVNGTDEAFRNNIASQIDIENFIDYFLLLNLTSAGDNTGKNMFFYKENSSAPLQIIPWDLDGAWGITYDGTRTGFESVLSNRLFERLVETNPDNFKQKLKNRWFSLRENSFSEEQLNGLFAHYFSEIEESGIIIHENRIWNEDLDPENERVYIENWMENRLVFLDNYFNQL
ncbi:MAG: CotH kinase family protein [Prolixibacteraceae bacterium]